MGLTAEAIADKWNISREDQDKFALNSHKKALNAIEKGYLKSGIVPITVTETYLDENEKRKEREYVVDTDEGPRKGGTIEALNKLRPVFAQNGSVTAGNAAISPVPSPRLLVLSCPSCPNSFFPQHLTLLLLSLVQV